MLNEPLIIFPESGTVLKLTDIQKDEYDCNYGENCHSYIESFDSNNGGPADYLSRLIESRPINAVDNNDRWRSLLVLFLYSSLLMMVLP